MADIKCPKCKGSCYLKRVVRPASTGIGLACGGITGWLAYHGGGKTGKFIGGLIAGDTGEIIGEIAGKIAGAIGGAAVSGYAGHKLGIICDENIIASYKCSCCGHEFRR